MKIQISKRKTKKSMIVEAGTVTILNDVQSMNVNIMVENHNQPGKKIYVRILK